MIVTSLLREKRKLCVSNFIWKFCLFTYTPWHTILFLRSSLLICFIFSFSGFWIVCCIFAMFVCSFRLKLNWLKEKQELFQFSFVKLVLPICVSLLSGESNEKRESKWFDKLTVLFIFHSPPHQPRNRNTPQKSFRVVSFDRGFVLLNSLYPTLRGTFVVLFFNWPECVQTPRWLQFYRLFLSTSQPHWLLTLENHRFQSFGK